MRKPSVVLFTMILAVSLFAFYGCPKSAEVSSEPELKVEKPAAPAADDSAAKAAEAKRAADAAEAARKADAERAANEAAEKERSAAAAAGLKPIFFDFDKSFVRDDAKAVMKANADYLKANPKVKVRIEGNCDERGTIEYNQALGQRRATAAKKYLSDLGVSSKRISLISHGKEKPVCTQSTEDCWQQNRRAELVAAQ